MRYRTSKKELEERLLQLEVDADILRMHIATREAEEEQEHERRRWEREEIWCDDCCRHDEQRQ